MKKLARKRVLVVLAVTTGLVVGAVTWVNAQSGQRVRTDLLGYQEVPVISTTGNGEFEAKIEDAVIEYTLTYELETPAVQAHIHFGQKRVATAGNIIAFLCGPGSDTVCPAQGTVTGTITPAEIIGPNAQGIEPGNYAEAVAAIRSGNAYVNVHSQRFPGGEIRGQLRDDRSSLDS